MFNLNYKVCHKLSLSNIIIDIVLNILQNPYINFLKYNDNINKYSN